VSERLFVRLAARLIDEPVVVASVLQTRGATPRKRGARMLVTPHDTEFSVGGGLAEARVIAAARELLAADGRQSELSIDLSGGPDAAGVCGGRMQFGLRCWRDSRDLARARQIASALTDGHRVELDGEDLGGAGATDVVEPNERLLIVGGGHCGKALYELAVHLDFDLWVFDDYPGRLGDEHFPGATYVRDDFARLEVATATERRVLAVLLNRDFHADVAALRALAPAAPAFIGMMGSVRRIAEVRAALPEFAAALEHLQAPVGMDIGAETPHEIAVSILARLIADRRAN
jgi:xanthine dehydrogenase accessory factor